MSYIVTPLVIFGRSRANVAHWLEDQLNALDDAKGDIVAIVPDPEQAGQFLVVTKERILP